jgi:sigma-B regulation protein RsbU (phosphoserine phosphatase)
MDEVALSSGSAEIDDDLRDTVLLLASELCDNATLHAGTEYEVEVTIDPYEIVVAVTDHGAGPLELYLAAPRPRFGRAATHGRGLLLIERLSTSWGTRHERDGTHRTWFSLARAARPKGAAPEGAVTSAAGAVDAGAPQDGHTEPLDRPTGLPSATQVRRLLHMPAELVARLEMPTLVAELVRRLREMLRADWVAVDVDYGDGSGSVALAHDGVDPTALPGAAFVELELPLAAPLRGSLRFRADGEVDSRADGRADRRTNGEVGSGASAHGKLAELTAERIALAVEMDWLRGADLRRRSWMTYLADASELLGQSMDVDLVVALVPQVVVPRLGQWCAVYLRPDYRPNGGPGTSQPRLAALTHAVEEVIGELRAVLEPVPPAELDRPLREMMRGGTPPAWFSDPTDGVAIGLTVHNRPIGALVVGRPAQRSHTPEDVALIGDIARRASLAIDNAQSTAAHIATSQALQRALLPRGLPDVDGMDFAAEYLPASAGSDIGGDFYDIVSIDANRWLASIGDVCGKGPAAAARTGMVRDVLRVLIREGQSLTRAVRLLNDVMMDVADPYQFCTLATALITRHSDGEPPGLTVDLVLAGHPQPLLVRADASTELIGRTGTAVGLVAEPRLVAATYRLSPGDTLLAYTDGVTERRRGREQFGSDRLLAAAGKGPRQTARQLIASVRAAVEAFSTTPPSDDIALLAVRFVE